MEDNGTNNESGQRGSEMWLTGSGEKKFFILGITACDSLKGKKRCGEKRSKRDLKKFNATTVQNINLSRQQTNIVVLLLPRSPHCGSGPLA